MITESTRANGTPMQLDPSGIVPGARYLEQLRDAVEAQRDDEDDADGDAREAAAMPQRREGKATRAPAVTPKDVVRLARARLREVRAELRRMKALQREEAQLARLLMAATGRTSQRRSRGAASMPEGAGEQAAASGKIARDARRSGGDATGR
jgi:hypothetical protein